VPAVVKEMDAQAIPKEEQDKVLGYMEAILNEVSEGPKDSGWIEQDAGWHPNLKDVLDTSRDFDGQE
jgi:hypothetical protein